MKEKRFTKTIWFSEPELEKINSALTKIAEETKKPYSFCQLARTAILESLEPRIFAKKVFEANKQILRGCFGHLDGKKIGNCKITVNESSLEFVTLDGTNASKSINCSEENFESKVRAYIKGLQA